MHRKITILILVFGLFPACGGGSSSGSSQSGNNISIESTGDSTGNSNAIPLPLYTRVGISTSVLTAGNQIMILNTGQNIPLQNEEADEFTLNHGLDLDLIFD